MCGIFGVITKCALSEHFSQLGFNSLVHRGPDGKGYSQRRVSSFWVGLGHLRLAIIDIDERASQPFKSDDGRYELVFNGEIYNYVELKKELQCKGYTFKTDSDTEVLLYAYVEWGTEVFDKLTGMFAFVILDVIEHRLVLARDPVGIKPLYYTLSSDSITFSSELPSLLEIASDHSVSINEKRLIEFLGRGISDDRQETLINGVYQVDPGSFIDVDMKGERLQFIKKNYWQPEPTIARSSSFSERKKILRDLLFETVDLHMRCDVPYGIANSGGIDSSAIVCIARHLYPSRDLHTFSFVSSDPKLTEERWIDEINCLTGAISHKVVIEAEELNYSVENIALHQGEPFLSPSIIAQNKVFERAQKSGIKVLLEGQGADEIFGGYSGFPGDIIAELVVHGKLVDAVKFLYNSSKWPDRSLAYCIAKAVEQFTPDFLYRLMRLLSKRPVLPKWVASFGVELGGHFLNSNHQNLTRSKHGIGLKARLAHSITTDRLPQLLRHGDRNAMMYSIENRTPFITTKIIDFALSLPTHDLVSKEGQTKYILRESMRGVVPDSILDRRDKIGFEASERGLISSNRDYLLNAVLLAGKSKVLDEDFLTRSVMDPNTGSIPIWRALSYLAWCKSLKIEPM
ncbi:asparagine synthase (glutamine-hydrolyzing) [Pseudobacteriovorax antillogorgiicola]|uniref:asparagine synthase (glutamine-hydrolyzing) n=1 Tax=Pseudobacteriovorax antillogorgiicola TaxID=1513793 RepID=A0A1Y6CSQ4_9BACT|nr:asparagine synthase (glutamine-hydrolyzing) [Pseudobacteriovorax antillogorgiicola]TCS45225.1 asparagine synthase (glutamine-hydrolysing) [Pseudobacteriovorax antillogorgiicola]SMF75387.1 asparagine synthase (glutamine-hydrolysing) [Pseudobacteriovorax antillogorgiicola]